MRIGFDAKRLFNNFTGLGNYSRFVVKALIDNAAQNEYLLYTPKVKSHPDIATILSSEDVSVITPPMLYKLFGATSFWRSWGVSKEKTISSLSVYHGLSQELPMDLPSHIKKVVTVHDLIFLRFPALYNPIDVAIYKAKVTRACKIADEIIAISQQTADDLTSFLQVPASTIKVIYQGCHPQFRTSLPLSVLSAIKLKYKLPSNYLLNVGTLELRKNIIVAVKALSIISEKVYLVIVGRETAYKQSVVNAAVTAGVLDQVIFLHDVPFGDLPALYQGADLFLYPSLFEGFGIPIVEAMESGVPVISSKGSCFQEAGGTDSIYVDPNDSDDLAFQIERVLRDSGLRDKMVFAGNNHIRKFTPDQIARDLMRVYAG